MNILRQVKKNNYLNGLNDTKEFAFIFKQELTKRVPWFSAGLCPQDFVPGLGCAHAGNGRWRSAPRRARRGAARLAVGGGVRAGGTLHHENHENNGVRACSATSADQGVHVKYSCLNISCKAQFVFVIGDKLRVTESWVALVREKQTP